MCGRGLIDLLSTYTQPLYLAAESDILLQRLHITAEARMRKSIRKTTFIVSVTYLHGGYSHNLIGSNFEIEDIETTSHLYIDLSGNLHVSIREVNEYQDAIDLIERHNELASIQIDEQQILDKFLDHYRKVKTHSWQCKLFLRVNAVFSYCAKLQNRNGSLFLELTPAS